MQDKAFACPLNALNLVADTLRQARCQISPAFPPPFGPQIACRCQRGTQRFLAIGSTATVTSTTVQNTVAAPVETCRSNVGNFRVSFTTSSTQYMYADTQNGMSGIYCSVRWVAPPPSSANAATLAKYSWYLDASGFLSTTYANSFKLISGAEFSPSSYLLVEGCVSPATGKLTLAAGPRKNILSCGGRMYISGGTGSDTGLPCVKVQPSIVSV
ncbi:hypothetical protein QBC43DRAFT_363631 [Cladorrhinum sp. PSN259]|nr:hypothetical protein QBC43DRAFT_363631 [Cladorrhinum sp. PSN259]